MSENSKKKAVIYCRVATSEDVKSVNPFSRQEMECRNFAEQQGYEIAGVFSDIGSGTRHEREALHELMIFCTDRQNDIEAIIARDPARLSRSMNGLSHIVSLLHKRNVEVRYVETALSDNVKATVPVVL